MAATKPKKSRSPDDLKKLAKLIKGIKFAMLTTATRDGTLRSRPMATQRREFDGDLWFFTDDDTAKVHEIHDDAHVNVAYADPDSNTYVSVSGRASLVKNRAKARELWNPAYRAWFPDGLDDPRLALIRVSVETAELWDTPSSAMVHLYGVVKAMVTGKPANPGDNKRIRLKPAGATGRAAQR